MSADNLVILRHYNTTAEAEIAKSILDSAGILCNIRNEYSSTLYPTGIIPACIVVREEDVKEAEALLTNCQ